MIPFRVRETPARADLDQRLSARWIACQSGIEAQRPAVRLLCGRGWMSTMKNNPQHPIAIMGLPLNSVTLSEAVDELEKLVLSGDTHQVCTVNLDIWLNALADPHLHRITAGCSFVVPDGMPLVWASKLLGCPLAERVTGVDLVPRLAELSAKKGYRIFLLGGRPGVAERAKELLERNYPGTQIVGTFSPAEENLIRMDHAEILNRVHEAKPDILLVAFGNPKQEKWIWMHRKRLGVPLSMGVGGSFDILVGDARRAPRWMQRCGLEWAVRFLQEPSRLGPRYLRDFVGLFYHLPMTLIANWMQRPYHGLSRVTTAKTPQVLHVYVQGKLAEESADPLLTAASSCVLNGLVMVVHLQQVHQTTAAGMGALMAARRQLLEAGLSLSLAGLSVGMRLLLYAGCAQPLFDEWQPVISRGKPLSNALDQAAKMELDAESDALPVQSRLRG
jgi:N-acetylglucosaminyldiphosphoundecaprenol N-acetyl-beta-D-mannosaminyltransferase